MSTVIFDMDGVLVDSGELTVSIIGKILERYPDCPSPARIRETFGMTMEEMWEHLMPGAPYDLKMACSNRYDQEIARELSGANVRIPGVKETLEQLKAMGNRLTIASNCGIPYLDAVLDTQGLRRYFTRPLCLESVQGQEKADILARHISKHPGPAVMVGDRRSDVEAAQNVDIPCIGVLSRFTGPGELNAADQIISDIRELTEAVPEILRRKFS